MRNLIFAVAVFLIAMPLAAQTSRAPVSGHADGQQEHRSEAHNDTITQTAAAMQSQRPRNTAAWTDATRLATLLRDVQTEVTLSPAVWRVVVNEANTLANRLYGRTARDRTARASARDLRDRVRELRTAGLRGDAVAARESASRAMPAAYALIDWSGPAQ